MTAFPRRHPSAEEVMVSFKNGRILVLDPPTLGNIDFKQAMNSPDFKFVFSSSQVRRSHVRLARQGFSQILFRLEVLTYEVGCVRIKNSAVRMPILFTRTTWSRSMLPRIKRSSWL